MVLYEYRCPECQGTQDTTVPGPIDCDKCSVPMKRTYSFSGTLFKGSGFYKTDKDKR